MRLEKLDPPIDLDHDRVLGHMLNLPPTAMAAAGAAVCFGIRFVAIRRGWHLPVAGLPQRRKSGAHVADVADDQQDERGG